MQATAAARGGDLSARPQSLSTCSTSTYTHYTQSGPGAESLCCLRDIHDTSSRPYLKAFFILYQVPNSSAICDVTINI